MSSTPDTTPRPLDGPWIHRTPTRTWYGPLDDVDADAPRGRVAYPWLARSLHVLRVLTLHEFRGRYRAQALGVIWSLANPLVMMAIFSVVFAGTFRGNTPHFPVFVLVGQLVWQWMSNAVSAGTQVFVVNADLIKRTVFAREALPLSQVASYAINLGLESLVLLLFIPVFPDAFRLSSALLAVPLLLLVVAALLAGVTLCTSVLNVIYRDVSFAVSTGLSILYWLTGVFYPMEMVPERYRVFLEWNPAAAALSGLRGAIIDGAWPAPATWLHLGLPTAAVLLLGVLVFRRYERMALDHV